MRRQRDGLHVWPAFTDLMGGVALILLVLGLRESQADQQRRELESRLAQAEAQAQRLQTELEKERRKYGVKSEIVERIKEELERHSIKVSINQIGNLEISADLLFATNQYRIPDALQPNALAIGAVFTRLFADPTFGRSISMLMVIGHTDQDGRTHENLELSTKRAARLVALWQGALPGDEAAKSKRCIVAKIMAAGMGEGRPLIADEAVGGKPGGECRNLSGEYTGCRRNRRIEIRVIPQEERTNDVTCD